MSLENVKTFYERLASDEVFRAQVQGVKSKEECSKIVKDAGYVFSQEEYEEYTFQLLETGGNNGELKDLDEKELSAVFGGASSLIRGRQMQPLYGVVRPDYQLPDYQLMYGVVRPPDDLF